ncbi:TPA: N-6 DNA methylase [Clostridium perfringens]|uniref:HsdM family class I SAM-dependent methyltransferase n=1 Tax=Clostridium perfringens TaxID=1502 RepID=UPI003AFF6E27
MSLQEFLDKIKSMIDELKSMSSALGLANTGDEYKIISELFTYKFLNDKLVYDFENREDKEESFEDFVYFVDDNTAKMKEEHLISNLFQKQNQEDFHKTLDKALVEISEMNKDIYAIETATGNKKPLFEPLSAYLRDEDKELELAKRAINILANDKYRFKGIYDGGFDYFSSVFEYLIKDYNKDSGKYAEYFTPLFAGNIMADILYNDTRVSNVTVYDPSAGSGTLLLALANKIGTNNCTIYSQDISQKSTQFLRINLILNKLVHSLHNVVEGNTLTNPQHLDGDDLKTFDFIVSNPPFNTDFSSMIEIMKTDKYNRFFAGLPNIPKKDLNSMAIYQCFLQHIISSLSDKGRAAIVVPTGFVSDSKTISKKIKKCIVDNNWLKGVIHMPSNIFANTGTSVSVIFIDKTKESDDIILMDASSLGTKVKFDEGQRTLLSKEERNKIVSYFKLKREEVEFSKIVKIQDIKENNYSIHAGQYFDIKEVELDFNLDEKLQVVKSNIKEILEESSKLDKEISNLLEDI